jgi:hypothetical protein
MSAVVNQGTAIEDSGIVLMARVQNISGTNITQGSVSGITYSVFDLVDGTAVVSGSSLTVSTVVFDTLQTPAIWTTDTTGYNFRHDAPATALPNGERTYRFEYKFTPTSGEVFWALFDINTIGVRTSRNGDDSHKQPRSQRPRGARVPKHQRGSRCRAPPQTRRHSATRRRRSGTGSYPD